MNKTDQSIVFYPLRENLYKKERLARYNFVNRFIRNKAVLEAGCGARDSALILSKSAGNIIAIDKSEQAIEFARRNFSAGNIEYLAMDCLDMKFQDGAFDAVISLEVIEHVLNERLYLKNIKKVLKKDGVYLGSTINKGRMGFDSDCHKERHHIKEYNLFEYTHLLKEYFVDVKIYGQCLKKDIDLDVKAVRNKIKTIDPFYIRRIIPAGFKEVILDFIRKANGTTPLSDIKEQDFYFSESNLGEARHFVAVCRK